jgi:hypothetical protein
MRLWHSPRRRQQVELPGQVAQVTQEQERGLMWIKGPGGQRRRELRGSLASWGQGAAWRTVLEGQAVGFLKTSLRLQD